jgi:hypothetical protein
MPFPGEAVFAEGQHAVRYVLQRGAAGSRHLCVVFAGMRREPKYTYVRTLAPVRAHRLFVLDDYGPHLPEFGYPGCYYLGRDREFSFEASVSALLNKVGSDLGVAGVDRIACGSSKGGWAALYYGFKYGFGHVVVGAPQTRLGHYLFRGKFKGLGAFIAGGSGEEDRRYLDSILFDMLSSTHARPRVHLHVGERERHREQHVEPLLAVLETMGVCYSVDLGDYDTHQQLRDYFPPYLLRTVGEIVGQPV